MAELEQLVRPYSPYEVLKKGATYKPEPTELEGTTVWTFGSAGDDVFALRASTQAEIDNEGTDHEVRRKFDLVKVKDPNNDENFIETEVMKEYEARNSISKDRIIIRFREQDPSANIEILKKDQTRNTPFPGS